MHATCPVHLFLIDLFSLIIFSEDYKLCSSLLCNFLQPSFTSLCVLPLCERPSFTPIQNSRLNYSFLYSNLYIITCYYNVCYNVINRNRFNVTFVGGKGAEEAAENRNYLAQRMTDELNEIIRVLQLTTYDEEEWDADNLTVMKKAQNAIEGKVRAAHDWLEVILCVSQRNK
jgi:hypothetical protein